MSDWYRANLINSMRDRVLPGDKLFLLTYEVGSASINPYGLIAVSAPDQYIALEFARSFTSKAPIDVEEVPVFTPKGKNSWLKSWRSKWRNLRG